LILNVLQMYSVINAQFQLMLQGMKMVLTRQFIDVITVWWKIFRVNIRFLDRYLRKVCMAKVERSLVWSKQMLMSIHDTHQHNMWPGLQKQVMLAHEIWLLFKTFMTHNFLWWYALVMRLSTLIKHLIG